ncbi:hypothetical protein FRX31_023636, partial [Thalictrum thalictroides]
QFSKHLNRKHLQKSVCYIYMDIPPQMSTIKINVDASFTTTDLKMGISYIVRDSNGMFIYAGSDSGTASSAEESEQHSGQGSNSI